MSAAAVDAIALWVCIVGAVLWLIIATRAHDAGRTSTAWIWLTGAAIWCAAAVLAAFLGARS